MALNSVEQTVLRRVSLSNEGCKPLQIFNFNWPIQVSTIQAECVSIRKMTLLEEFTLRAFNEIEGVDAAQIAEELGLEAKLIEETLDNLMASQAIEAQQGDNYNSVDISELREEILNLQAEIEQKNHRLNWLQRTRDKSLRLKKNKLKLAKAALANLEAKDTTVPQGTSWFAKLRNSWKIMRSFTAKVTPRGKENLAKGLIDMPAKTISMHLCRCPISDQIFPMNDLIFRREDLVKLESESSLIPYDLRKIKPVNQFSDRDVKNAFERGRSLESEVEIRSQVMKDEDPIVEAIPVYCVLLLNKEGQCVWSIMRANRKPLTWAEDELNRNQSMQDKLLQSLGKSKSKNQVKISNIRPAQATKNDMLEVVNKARTVIIRDPLSLDEGERDTLDTAVSNAALFTINDTASQAPTVESEDPLRVSILAEAIQGSGIFSEFGHVCPGFVNVNLGSKNYKIDVNEVSDQPTIFSALQEEILPKLSPNIRFRMSQSESDFREWADFEMNSVKSLDEFEVSLEKLQSAGSTMSFSIENIIGENLREIMSRIIDTNDDSQLLQIQDLSESLNLKIWDSVAANIQSTMVINGEYGDCLKVWQKHNTGEKILPHEDAASLENHLFASCDQTALHVKRSFEKSLRNLAKENGVITGGDLSMVINELEKSKIISPKLRQSADRVRKIRNRFIHTEAETATLKQVLMSINVTRELRTLLKNNDQSGYWEKPNETQWDEVLDENELKESIIAICEQCRRFHQLGLPLNGNIWGAPLFNRIPTEFNDLNIEILEEISSTPEFSTGPPFSTIAVEIAKRSMKGFLSKHNPENFAFPTSMVESLNVLNEMDLEDVTKQILSDVVTSIPRPIRTSELMHEASNSELIDEFLKPETLTQRWYSSIRDKDFICNFEELSTGNQLAFDRLPRKARENLLDKAIKTWRHTLKRGEFEALQPLSEQLHLMQANGWPGIAAGDGRLENAVRRQLATNDNPQAVAKKLSELHNENNPLFPEHLKKCNKHITDFINKNMVF